MEEGVGERKSKVLVAADSGLCSRMAHAFPDGNGARGSGASERRRGSAIDPNSQRSGEMLEVEMAKDLSWMWRLVEASGSEELATFRPFQFSSPRLKGMPDEASEWAIACSRYAIVAVRSASPFPKGDHLIKSSAGLQNLGMMESLLWGDVPGDSLLVSLLKFKNWIGDPSWVFGDKACHRCSASGRRDRRKCMWCEGSGKRFMHAQRPGIFKAVLIDRELAAKSLHRLTTKDDTIRVLVYGKAPIRIEAEKWRVVMMPMAGEISADYPVW